MSRTILVSATLLLGTVGCLSGEDALTWEEFKELAYHDPETDSFVANGDELFETEAHLRAFYEEWRSTQTSLEGVGRVSQGLVVNQILGLDTKWDEEGAVNLTYCVSRNSFGARYDAVVNALLFATTAWENAARVDFIHLTAEDNDCTSSNSDVLFDIRQTNETSFLARAFLPLTFRSNRNLLISTTAFGDIAPLTLAGILRHELGHILGFRHEHTRPEAGVCFENNSWRPLTSYDSASVMHYPQCNGTNQGNLLLTTRDRQGAAALYPE